MKGLRTGSGGIWVSKHRADDQDVALAPGSSDLFQFVTSALLGVLPFSFLLIQIQLTNSDVCES